MKGGELQRIVIVSSPMANLDLRKQYSRQGPATSVGRGNIERPVPLRTIWAKRGDNGVAEAVEHLEGEK